MADSDVPPTDGDHVMREPDAVGAVPGIVPLDVVVDTVGKSDRGEPKARKKVRRSRKRSRPAEKASDASQDLSEQPESSRRPEKAKVSLDLPIPMFPYADIRDLPADRQAALQTSKEAFVREVDRQKHTGAGKKKVKIQRWLANVLPRQAQPDIHPPGLLTGSSRVDKKLETLATGRLQANGIVADADALMSLLRSLSIVVKDAAHESVAGFMRETLYQPTFVLTDMRDLIQTREIVSQAEFHYASMENSLNYAYTRFDTFSYFVRFYERIDGRVLLDASFGHFLDWKRDDGFVTLASLGRAVGHSVVVVPVHHHW